MKYFVGVDLSLTETGVVVLDRSFKILHKELIKTISTINIEARILEIRDGVIKFFNKDSIIYLEGLSFGSRGQSMLELAGLHYFVRAHLYQNNHDFKLIPPTVLKKFITGKGNCKKELMLLKVYKRFGIEFDNNNLCDAYSLARLATEEYKDD
jgi:crossover junction endodeoxyribonuclease RuvC